MASLPGVAAARRRGITAPDVAALLLLVALAALYFFRLDSWLINDDEGSYLYAAWRISLGELPYRDFLTPQLPAFLLTGGALMRLMGASVAPLRALCALLTLGAGAATWAAARRLFGGPVALLAGTAVLAHPLVFADDRTYRPEPFMLFLTTVGVALFIVAAFPRRTAQSPPSRVWLTLSGGVFGVAVLAKLFGVLPLAGCLLWLAADGRTRGRPLAAIAKDIGVAGLAFAAAVALGMGAFLATSGRVVLDDVLGHHLRQGAGMAVPDVAGKAIGLFLSFIRVDTNGLLIFVALAAAAGAWRYRERRALLLAWQLPTVLVFLLMTRQLFTRHLIYLIPALCTLFAVEVAWVTGRPASSEDGRRIRRLAVALAAALVLPWLINDWHRAWEWETGTWRAGDMIQLTTAPEDLVLADYSELNFYGQRPTTYSAASLSQGAAASGQITWSDPASPHRLQDELENRLPALVLVDTATEFSQLAALRDWDHFSEWLERNYGPPAGVLVRHTQVYDVYAPRDRPLPVVARYGGGLVMLGAGTTSGRALPSGQAVVRSAWLAEQSLPDLAVHAGLVDDLGREWAGADAGLSASGTDGMRRRLTSRWQDGEMAADRTAVDVPPGTPPGSYALDLVLYDPVTLHRLEASAADGSALGQKLTVGRVAVAPTMGDARAAPKGAVVVAAPAAGVSAGVRLLGSGDLPTETLQAGTTVDLDLWWTGRRTAADLAARVTLANPENGAVAADVTSPLGIPGAGTSSWPAEPILVRQQLRLPILAGAADGTYQLGVAVLGPSGQEVQGRLVLGSLAVRGRDLSSVVTQPPAVVRQLDAVFGDIASLYGAAGSGVAPPGRQATAQAGATVEVELVWRALASAAESYKVSLQLLGADGHVWAQDDSVPGNWTRPTTGWLPGEVVLDAHPVALPTGMPPGTYRWVVALYDPDSLRRLPVSGRDASGDVAEVGQLAVAR